MVDRFAFAPVLIPIALDFHAPLGGVAIAATAYYLAYGLAQPLWGFASDRFGRIRVMRLSLAATAAGCALSGLAPNLGLLIAARIVDGAAVCAILPRARWCSVFSSISHPRWRPPAPTRRWPAWWSRPMEVRFSPGRGWSRSSRRGSRPGFPSPLVASWLSPAT